jgi:glycosyltransferase involved in cell wall biosynthesis
METILRYPVDIYGNGWDHIARDGAAARFHGPMTWNDMITRLPNYTGCLSTNPLVEESVHDRVFFALAAGVPPVSDANGFARSYMPDLQPYMFDFTRERIEQAVEALLDNPADAIARTEETWRSLAVPFGLKRSARQIVQFASLHGLNAPIGF